MAQINVLDAAGATQTAARLTNTGPQTAAESLSVTPSSSGFAVTVSTSALPNGAATAANQDTANTSLSAIATAAGTPADASASSDTGSFGLIALVKRALQNWTTLLARIPALSGGRIPVDGSGVTQPVSIAAQVAVTGPLTNTELRATAVPVSAASLPLPTGAATSALQGTGNTSLASIDGKVPALVAGRMPVDGSGVTQPIDPRAREVTGTISSGLPTIELDVSGMAAVAVDVRGTWTGVVTLQGTINGTDWFTVQMSSPAAGLNFTLISSTNVNGNWVAPCAGLLRVRANFSTPTSGTPSVVLRAAMETQVVYSLQASGTATSALQTTGNTSLSSIAGLQIPAHDHITLGYTGSDLTSVVYRTGGAGGTVVGTLTLAYTGGNLTSITRT